MIRAMFNLTDFIYNLAVFRINVRIYLYDHYWQWNSLIYFLYSDFYIINGSLTPDVIFVWYLICADTYLQIRVVCVESSRLTEEELSLAEWRDDDVRHPRLPLSFLRYHHNMSLTWTTAVKTFGAFWKLDSKPSKISSCDHKIISHWGILIFHHAIDK